MWADNETTTDLLNVGDLVQVVADTIRTERLLPLTIGIYGGWGSGKSSLVKMVRKEVEDDEGVVCVTFNGWLFENYEDAKSALMGTILDEIRSRRTLSPKARDLVSRLSARVDWFRVMALAGKGAVMLTLGGAPAELAGAELTFAGMKAVARNAGKAVAQSDEKASESLMKDSADLNEPAHPVRAFREDFAKLLDESNIRTLVVFIDELDRCLPETVVETLEAIRLFLFTDRTAFVVGADERLVQHAVRRRFSLEGMDPQIGSDYLEKMIQIPFRIPPLGPQEIHTYMNLLFAELCCEEEAFRALLDGLGEAGRREYGELRFSFEEARELLDPLPPELADGIALTEQLADTLTSGVSGNPRQTKRFLNALLLRMRLAELRGIALQRRVLGKLMLLEYFRGEHFRILAGWQGRQAGFPEEITALEAAVADSSKASAPDIEPGMPDSDEENNGPVEGGADAHTTIPEHATDWLDDGWLQGWLSLEPNLAGVDLRAYFYIAREKIGHAEGPLLQLTPAATQVLQKLRSASQSVRNAGKLSAEGLSPGEATGVFQELTNQVRRMEQLAGVAEPPLDSLFLLAEARSELSGELVAFLRSLPEGQLKAGIVPRLVRAVEGSPAEAHGKELIEAWSRSTVNPRLGKSAQTQLRSKPTPSRQ